VGGDVQAGAADHPFGRKYPTQQRRGTGGAGVVGQIGGEVRPGPGGFPDIRSAGGLWKRGVSFEFLEVEEDEVEEDEVEEDEVEEDERS